MKKIVLIAATILLLISCKQPSHTPEDTNIIEEPQLENVVFQFIHSFTSPSMLIWDARSSEIIFQCISTRYTAHNGERIIVESIKDYNFMPLSLYCKADSASSAFIRDSLNLTPKDFRDKMPQIEDGIVTRIMGIYNDGTFLTAEFNTPNENQASLGYLLLHIAAQNQPDSLSNEYLKYIRDSYEQEATKVQFLEPLVERRRQIDEFINKRNKQLEIK